MTDEDLPTEPGIYVSLRPGWEQQAPLTLSNYGEWFQYGNPVDPRAVLIPWNGLVRLEPRNVTARAVLDRVLDVVPWMRALDNIAEDFGVES